MSVAAKDPTKTSTFLDAIDTTFEKFDDEISSVSADVQQAAYHNLVMAYHKALGTIWDKTSLVDIDMILGSVADREFKEYRRMVHLLQPAKEHS